MLKTNDPVNKNIELRIQGQVFSDLVIPDSVGMPKGDLGEVLEAEFLVHSQVYNDISLLAVECDLPGFQWSAEPASDKDVELLHSTTKSAVKVKILCKPVRRGEFASTMALKLITDSGATIERSINCSGKLRASISFYDANIYMKEGLDMGTLTSGKRHEFAIIVRADDKERDLEVLRVEPPEVKATIKPLGQSGAYRLVIYVPEDCPTVIFNLDSKRGYVEVGDPDEKSYSNWLPIYGAVARPEL